MLKLLTNKFNPLMPTVAIWRAERQSAQMSKITNDGLTRSGTGCSIAVHMATVGVKGLTVVQLSSCVMKV